MIFSQRNLIDAIQQNAISESQIFTCTVTSWCRVLNFNLKHAFDNHDIFSPAGPQPPIHPRQRDLSKKETQLNFENFVHGKDWAMCKI